MVYGECTEDWHFRETSEIWTHICSCHNFPPFFCADTFVIYLLLIVCALRWYVKCLYRHLFLEDTSKKAMVTQTQTVARIIPRHLGLQMPRLVCGLPKLWCGSVNYHLSEALRVMVIRRGDITDIAWVFVWLEMNCLITYQRKKVLILCHHYIITKCFDKPQTKSGHL